MAHSGTSIHSTVSSLSPAPSIASAIQNQVASASSAPSITVPAASSQSSSQTQTPPSPQPPSPPPGSPLPQNITGTSPNPNSNNSGVASSTTPPPAPLNNATVQNTQNLATNGAASFASAKHQSSWFTRNFDDWWAWEILAGLFGTCCLVTIIIVLAVYDGNPQPELRWGITLNAVAALITTAMKGALLTPLMEGMSQFKWITFAEQERPLIDFNVYDGASRGGLNALTLFWHMRRKFWREVTALAALFYFLSFGVDTFVQQLIQTEYQNSYTPTADAFLLRNQRYDSYSEVADDQGSIEPRKLDPDMSGAVYTALYSTRLPNQDLFQCPESNCTYPITPSLAVCGRCHDLSSEVAAAELIAGSGYRLPQGPEVSGNVFMNVTATTNASETNSFTDFDPLIVSFAYVNTTNYLNDNPKAGECALYPCVQELQSEVRQGRLNETVVREWTHVAPRPITNVTDVAIGVWSYWMDVKVDTNGMKGEAAGMDFNFSIQAFLAMRFVLPQLFQGQISGGAASVEEGQYYSSDVMQQLYFTPDMNELIDRLSVSMTSSIRRAPAPGAMIPYGNITETTQRSPYPIPRYTGGSLRLLPFINIVWPWIALPAATVLFSNVFLIYAMARTKQAQKFLDIGIWKSSCLPVLYHGLDTDALVRAGIDPTASTSIAYLEENASQLGTRLNLIRDEIKLS